MTTPANLYKNFALTGSYEPVQGAPITLPVDWLINWTEGTITEPGQSHEWKRPAATAHPGNVEIWLEFGPLWAAFSQHIALVQGAAYRLSFSVEPSPRHPDAQTVAMDPISVEARLFFGSVFGAWANGDIIKPSQRTGIHLDWIADRSASVPIGIEVRARHSLFTNLFTLREPSLVMTTPAPNAPGGEPTSPANSEKAQALALQNLIHQQLNLAQIQLDAARTNMQALGALIDRLTG